LLVCLCIIFFFQAEDGIRDPLVTGVQTCALPIFPPARATRHLLATSARPGPHGFFTSGSCKKQNIGNFCLTGRIRLLWTGQSGPAKEVSRCLKSFAQGWIMNIRSPTSTMKDCMGMEVLPACWF